MLNKAHEDELLNVSPNWFEKVYTRIYKSTESEGKSLDRNTLLKIEDLDLTANDSLAFVRDMFMFGVYCEGMELMRLKINLHSGSFGSADFPGGQTLSRSRVLSLQNETYPTFTRHPYGCSDRQFRSRPF